MTYLKIYLLFLSVMLGSHGLAQHIFKPENLGDSVNSGNHEINPVISPDENTLFFIRTNHPNNKKEKEEAQEIWFTQKSDSGNWTLAQKMPKPFNSIRFNNLLGISQDGNRFYINGRFYKDLSWRGRGVSVISKNSNGSFSKPEKVKIKAYNRINKGRYTTISVNEEETIMLLSFSRKWDGENSDIYVSHKRKNKWDKPKKLQGVNTKHGEFSPSLSADGTTLYFSRKTPEGVYIYAAERKTDSYQKWGNTKKLHTEINKSAFNGYFTTSQNGSHAYFSATSTENNSNDIYVVKLFEENPYVLLKGKVLNEKSGEPVSTEGITIEVEGLEDLEFNMDSANSTYSLLLPLEANYKFGLKKENWTSVPDSLDARDIYEYTEIQRDLYLTPLPYVRLRGKILTEEETPIDSSNFENILINGTPLDSVVIDSAGNYEALVSHGKSYIVEAQVKGYLPVESGLDLKQVYEYQEVELDLEVTKKKEKVKQIVVQGNVINTITQEPADSALSIDIMIGDYPAKNTQWVGSHYSIKLPLKASYLIYADVDSYYPVIDTIDLQQNLLPDTIHQDLYITPLEVGKSINLDNIFFETGKAILRKESYEELDRVVRLLKTNTSINIEIAGHTDDVGNADFNKALSLDRAKAVSNYFKQKGIDEKRISSKGYGMEKPIASNETEEGRSKNRRVEFTIIDK
ncbi:OmpA family protein [Cytophagaceae bacterium ABcell3]|nr:OmpA family protein [Cytophagaceae bacterium ABcell3]